MTQSVHPAAIDHVPGFIVEPGQPDRLLGAHNFADHNDLLLPPVYQERDGDLPHCNNSAGDGRTRR